MPEADEHRGGPEPEERSETTVEGVVADEGADAPAEAAPEPAPATEMEPEPGEPARTPRRESRTTSSPGSIRTIPTPTSGTRARSAITAAGRRSR